MPTVLARNLYRRRRALGYSQLILAEHAGISQSWVSRIEAGQTPSLGMLSKLARYLKTDISTLMTDAAKGRAGHAR